MVYCPDQLGPAVARLLPDTIEQVVYPTLAAPQRIDWVDYAARNAAADPALIAAGVAARTANAIWLVTQTGYRTFDTQCERLAAALGAIRGAGVLRQAADPRVYEGSGVIRNTARSSS